MISKRGWANALYRRATRWVRAPWVAYAPVFVAIASLTIAAYFIDASYGYSNRIDLRLKAATQIAIKTEILRNRIQFELASVGVLQRAISEAADLTPEAFDAKGRAIMADNPDIVAMQATDLEGKSMTLTRDDRPVDLATPKNIGRVQQDYMVGTPPGFAIASFSQVTLVGRGLYGFHLSMPVFAMRNGAVVQWGSVSAVIDAGKFFRKSGMSYFGGSHRFAVRIEGAGDASFKPYFRIDQVKTVFGSDPVVTSVNVLSSTWQVAAIPVGGWDRATKDIFLMRALLLLVILALVLPFLRGARLRRLNDYNRLAIAKRETALKFLTTRLDLALQSYHCGIWEAAANVDATYWDDRMQELHGVRGRQDWATRRNWLSLVHPDDKAEARKMIQSAMEKQERFSLTSRIIRPDGDVRHIRYVSQFHEGPDGIQRLYGIAVDVTEDVTLALELKQAKTEMERKNAELEEALLRLSGRESQLKVTTERFKIAVDAYGCGIWETNLDTGESYWDERMHILYGIPYTDGQTAKEMWLSHVDPTDKIRIDAARERAVSTNGRFHETYRIIHKSGEVRHIKAVGFVNLDPNGARKFIGLSIDVTDEIKRSEALITAKNDAEAKRAELEAMHTRLQHNATHDPLTGLQNRRALDAELERLAGEPRSAHRRVTLLHIDLDRFKQINDTLGHAAGDAMLTHAADVLRKNTRKSDLVARIGGDEFVVLIRSEANNQEISSLAKRIIDCMNVPIEYHGHECRFGVSIGIAREQPSRNTVKNLLVNADIALYRAKAHGRNRHEFYTASLQAEIRRNKTLADQILRGIENGEFHAWYQPQFCAETHELAGVEALVRWNHPERGLLAPDAFLKTAEEINALATIDRLVLEQSLTDRLKWVSKGLIVPKISVNVSARRLRDDQLVKSLKELSIVPGQIAFELVESIYLDDDDDIIRRNIRRLKGLGIDIEIDDFGTGHTSIVSLLKLEPKRLKIDRQLVQPMLTSPREFSLVRSIIEIGASLDIETVAEGVETTTHALRLRELGCTMLQGYAFARPMPAKELVGFVEKRAWKEEGDLPRRVQVG